MVDELQSCVGTCLGEESKKACARSKGLFPNGFGSVRAYGVRWMMAEDFFTYLSLLSDLRDVWLEQQEPWELRELTAIHLRNPQYVHDWVTKARPSEELIQLRVGFDKEHSRIMNAAEGSSSDDIPLNPEAKRLFKTWAHGFDVHKRAAWKSAIKTLRRLCNGRAPRKVNDVIMFLTMSRVMTSIMDSVDGNSLLSDYDRDIGRWRVLFKDDPVAEHRFAEAVLSIWGIDVHESSDVLPLDREALKQALEAFRALSIEFVERASSVFDISGPTDFSGLKAARTTWQQKYPDGRTMESKRDGEDLEGFDDDPPSVDERGSQHPTSPGWGKPLQTETDPPVSQETILPYYPRWGGIHLRHLIPAR